VVAKVFSETINLVEKYYNNVKTLMKEGKLTMDELKEQQREQAEEWLVTELNRAEADFGEGEDIDVFAEKYQLKDLDID